MSEYIVEVNENPTVTFDGLNVRCGDVLIQREEIVRCKDCKHYKDRNGAILPGTVCQRLGYYNFKVEPDGFCAWGKKDE